MITVLQRLKNIVKTGRWRTTDDSGNMPRGTVSYMSKTVPAVLLKQYGFLNNPPPNSFAVIFAQNGQESNAIAIVDDPRNRTLKNLASGEVAINNQVTGSYVYLKSDSSVETKVGTTTVLIEGSKITATVGATTFTVEGGTVTVDAANLQVNGNIDLTGDINADGDVNADGEVKADAAGPGVKLSTHTHNFGPPPDPGS